MINILPMDNGYGQADEDLDPRAFFKRRECRVRVKRKNASQNEKIEPVPIQSERKRLEEELAMRSTNTYRHMCPIGRRL